MKGGGSRLNVNTDKPHSLISIKNKVLPTSPPARQSPQAPPTAAPSGGRESGSPESLAAGAAPFPAALRAARRPPPAAPGHLRPASATPCGRNSQPGSALGVGLPRALSAARRRAARGPPPAG